MHPNDESNDPKRQMAVALHRMRERLQECNAENLLMKEEFGKVAYLLEPPYFIALFRGPVEAPSIMTEKIRKRLDINVNIKHCLLMLSNGDEIIGSFNEKAEKNPELDELVIINRENYSVISVFNEMDAEKLSDLAEGTVQEVVGELILASRGSQNTSSVIVSRKLKKELGTIKLEVGDRVLLFSNTIVKVLEHKELPTSKKNINKVTLKDIAGLDKEIQEVRDLLGLDFNKESAQKMNKKFSRGVVLHGPPGNAKTTLAAALANELGFHLEVINGAEITSMWVGETPRMLRESFHLSLKHKPSLWVIDEADSLFPVRGSSIAASHKTDYISQFNVLLQGIEDTEGVFVILLTNRIDQIDPAVIRAGRFARKIFIPRPDEKRAIEILKIHLKKHPVVGKGSQNEIITYWAEQIARKLFLRSPDTYLFASYESSDDPARKFYFLDFISGALLENIVDELAIRALKRMDEQGIKADDPNFGIAEEDLRSDTVTNIVLKEIPRDDKSLAEWLLVNGYNRPETIDKGKLLLGR